MADELTIYAVPTEYPEYHYEMGLKVNGSPIPDPKVFTGAESDLDTMGERDQTGTLHRNRCATKHPLKLEYENIEVSMMRTIAAKLRDAQFTFTYPDPFYDQLQSITAYVGDRNWEYKWCPPGGIALGNLKFSIIEY